jgi:hypothetical protein
MEAILETLKSIQATQAQHTEAFKGVLIALSVLRNDMNALQKEVRAGEPEAMQEGLSRLQASYNTLAVRVAVLEQV